MVEMDFRRPTAGWRRVAAAAGQLAALYALGVVCLLGPLLLMLEGPTLTALLEAASIVALPLAVLFTFAFVILAVARRAGFGILWGVLLALWTWMAIPDGVSPWIPTRFLGWSTLALPLFTIGALGVRAPSPARTVQRWIPRPRLTTIIWLVLAAVALYYSYLAVSEHAPASAPTSLEAAASRVVWFFEPVFFLVPFAIPLVEFVRIWVATAGPSSERAAA